MHTMSAQKIFLAAFCLSVAFVKVKSSWLNHLNLPETEPNADPLPAVAKAEGENTLVELVTQAGLAGTLSGTGTFTLFGPTDQAFGKVPAGIIDYLKNNNTALAEVLKYHVLAQEVFSSQLSDNLLAKTLQGSQIRINIYKNGVTTASGRPVVKVNVNASNGVLHELGGVMLPPVGDIVDTVTYPGMEKSFGTLVTAVKAADLVSALKGTGPLTVFAPTNEAFAKLGKKALDDLLKNKKKLQSVLKYHVVSAAAYSAGLQTGQVQTLNGQSVNVNVGSGKVTVNKANVIFADITTSNGVIHVIDTVLLPPTDEAPPSFEIAVNSLKFDPLRKILRLN